MLKSGAWLNMYFGACGLLDQLVNGSSPRTTKYGYGLVADRAPREE